MTVNRTTLLDLPLPVTGTESGTWGDTTNNGLTQYMDIAVAGMTSLTSANFTAGALTLANTTGDSSATNIAAGSAQYGAIKVSSLATNSTITAPSSNRRYTIINADATYSVTIKASGQTGVVIAAGEKALVAFNGTDYVKIATANGTGEFTTVDTTNLEVTNIKAKDGTAAATIADSTGVVTVTAAPVMTALTASQAVFTTAGKALTSNAITGTGNVVMSASPTLTGTISAAAATLSGNLTLSGGTANGVLYLDGSKVATSGSALTFDGTSLSVSGPIKLTATTTAPSVNNEFVAYSTNGYTYITGGTNGLIVGNNSGGDTRIRLEDANNIQFEVNSAEGMRLTSTGLGVGTSSPASQIHINGNADNYFTAGLRVNRYTTTGQYVSINYVNGVANIVATDTALSSPAIRFLTSTDGSTATEQMRLDSTGLGIGTSSPGVKLEVSGAAASAAVTGSITNTDASGFSVMRLRNTGTSGKEYQIVVGGHTSASVDNFYVYDATAAAVRLTLDSSGNLGLGVTPSAWGASWKALELPNGVASSSAFGINYQTVNAYHDGSNFIYKTSSVASYYQNGPGSHAWYTAPSGTAGNAITFTQAMTLGSDGLFQVGTTTGGVNDGKLQVSATGTGSGAANTVVGLNVFEETSGNKAGLWFGAMTNSNVGVIGSRTASGSIAFQTYSGSWGERARITSGGTFCVHDGTLVDSGLVSFAKTTETSVVLAIKNPQYSCDMWATNTSGDNVWARFFSETTATQRGSISYNRTGGLVAYNTTSDYRAKDILGSVTNSGATIDALKVYEGKMKGATQSRPMLVAHEAQAVAPYAVTGEKDAVDDDGNPKYQQMDVSSFVPLLIAEIQSLRQRVAQLEGTQP